jgi:hypothetical protein
MTTESDISIWENEGGCIPSRQVRPKQMKQIQKVKVDKIQAVIAQNKEVPGSHPYMLPYNKLSIALKESNNLLNEIRNGDCRIHTCNHRNSKIQKLLETTPVAKEVPVVRNTISRGLAEAVLEKITSLKEDNTVLKATLDSVLGKARTTSSIGSSKLQEENAALKQEVQGWKDAWQEQKCHQSFETIQLKEELNLLKEQLRPIAVDAAMNSRTMLYAFASGVKELDALVYDNATKLIAAKQFILKFIIGKENFDLLTEEGIQTRYGTALPSKDKKWQKDQK